MRLLKTALPFLTLELESALVHIGRGDMADQLCKATIERWTYDEASNAAYIHFRAPDATRAGIAKEEPGDAVSVYDELGIILETDSRGQLTGMEVLDGKEVVAQLEMGSAAGATSPRSP